MELFALPEDLEEDAITKFDNLVREGQLHYEEPTWKRVREDDLTLSFLMSSALLKKPILSKSTLAKTGGGESKSPFVDLDPKEVVCQIGPSHTLIFNKYCATRPMFIIVTNDFQLQTDALNITDITAAWTLLTSFKQPQTVIFNCGADAGASQGHKHMQMFPTPDEKDCIMFPAMTQLALGRYGEYLSDSSRPFHNFIIGLDPDITPKSLLSYYDRLLAASKIVFEESSHGGSAYNLVLTRKWMAMVPRTHANSGGKAPTNAAGMMGMVWASREEEVAMWQEIGLKKHLAHMGLPR